jgi:hypothetical protein
MASEKQKKNLAGFSFGLLGLRIFPDIPSYVLAAFRN